MSIRQLTPRLILLFAVALALMPASHAQQDYLLQLGTPPGQPSMEIPMGVVGLGSGNVHLEFPLRTYIQRNGAKVTSKLIYDSENCYLDPYAYSVWRCSSGWREITSPFQ